ncbi:hypothetical protein, partial [Janthinobacterium sp.]|uniref:hypothetical protein n=1 Tax=Janthinobacterium sp. TaxID=1871054 RepID=UPI00261B6B67
AGMGFFDAMNLLPAVAFKAALVGMLVAPVVNILCRYFDLNFYINAGLVAVALLLLISPQLKDLYFAAEPASLSIARYADHDVLWVILKTKFWGGVVGYCAGSFVFWKVAG